MNRSVIISIVLSIAAVLWILSGSIGSDDTSQEFASATNTDAGKETQPFKVSVRQIKPSVINDSIELQGEIDALRDIEIKAETRGTVSKINVEQGGRVKAKQSLLQIAINDRQARLEQAKAELRVRQADLEAGKKLRAKNLISENQHEQNLANVSAAEAAVKQIEVEISQTRVEAAFAGVLNTLHVEEGDYLAAGDPIATLVDDSKVIIRAEVPQQHIARITEGQTVTARLLDGTEIDGQVQYISTAADPATRTFTIEASADNRAAGVRRFGQSARIVIELGDRKAHKLSPSLLDLDNKGELRVKGVTPDNRVITQAVSIIRNETDGVWLDGIPDDFTLITVGQAFVAQGDLVKPVDENTSTEERL